MNIVIANGPGRLDTGSDVILFPSRWDSAVPQAPFRFYPYELGYLSALLKREMPDAQVTLLDGNAQGWGAQEYAEKIAGREPDYLICECSALTYATMTRVMQQVGAHSILCGPIGTYGADGPYLDGWDTVVSGEYEHKVLSVVRQESQPAGYIDLDWLPWPEDEDIRRIDYQEINHYRPGIVQLYASRGCPLACTFCVVPLYYGGHGHSHHSHRTRDVANICQEIDYLATKYPQFSGCYFNEEAHNAKPAWVHALCDDLIATGLDRFHYDAMCGYWTFDEDLVKHMAEAGYGHIRFGVESTSEQVGRSIRKTMHLERIEQLLQWLYKYGVRAYGTFQIGAPGSTEETDLQTVRDLRRWRSQGLMQRWQVSTSTPQPGTPFFRQAREAGWLVTEDLNRYDGYQPVVSYPDYPAERIFAVRRTAG